jgi:hypothetical protein
MKEPGPRARPADTEAAVPPLMIMPRMIPGKLFNGSRGTLAPALAGPDSEAAAASESTARVLAISLRQ